MGGKAVWLFVLAGGLVLVSSPAFAQEEGEEGVEASAPAAPPDGDAKEVEEIVVTGTRIGRSNLEEFAHITVLTAKDIALSGVTTVDELLTAMPSVTLQGLNKQNNNGGNGLAFVDLRNLGVSRTLVLVNGKRFIKSGAGAAVDLNNIPVAMIERVEVLLDGASAAYGSDAIGGVINIILKDDFQGFEAELSGGITTHGDGDDLQVSLTGGVSGEKGNVAANFTYTHGGKIAQKDRAWARYPVVGEWYNDDGSVGRAYGSGTHQGGRYFGVGADGSDVDVYFNPNGTWADFGGDCQPGMSAKDCELLGNRYNYGNDQWLVGEMERFSATLFGNYDLSENVRAYLEGTYTNRWSRHQLAPQPLGFGTNAYPDFFVPYDNPYMPQAFRNSLDPTIGGVWLLMRPTQLGRRIYDNDSDTFQLVAGVKGDIIDNLSFDVYFNYGHHANTTSIYNSINMKRAIETADPALCGNAVSAAAGCAVGNWFGEGNLSKAVLDYIRYTDVETTGWDMFQVAGQVSGKFFDLPGGPFGAALGVETRKESGFNRPSVVTQGEEASGNGLDPTEGSYNAQEVFAEVSLPLVKDLPAVHALTVDLAARFSHFNTFGNDLTYRAGLSWAPIVDIWFWGVFFSAFRAPDIADLYGGAADSYEALSDPCNNWGLSTDPILRANCAAQGVPQDFDQNAAGGSQIRTNVGGNQNLGAESALVANAGIVFTPRFAPDYLKGLSMSFDFYWVKVDNAITNPDPQWILNSCYQSEGLSHPNCAKIADRNRNSVITSMNASLQNIAQIETMGLDITLNYSFDAGLFGGPRWLRFDLGWHGNYLLSFQETSLGETIDYEGTITNGTAGGSYAHLRWVLSLAVSGEVWSVGTRVRYIGPADIFAADPELDPTTKVSAMAYWDLYGQYTWDSLVFILGINNIIESDPPFILEGGQNANVQTYDFAGRYIYAKVGYKF
jgi:iron complex outermembrane receptor protein